MAWTCFACMGRCFGGTAGLGSWRIESRAEMEGMGGPTNCFPWGSEHFH